MTSNTSRRNAIIDDLLGVARQRLQDARSQDPSVWARNPQAQGVAGSLPQRVGVQ